MQTTLALGLIKSVVTNRRHGIKGSKLFESGRGYFDFNRTPLDKKTYVIWKNIDRKGRHLTMRAKNEPFRPTERQWLAGIIDHPISPKSWHTPETKGTFFNGKDVLQTWLGGFGIRDVQWHAAPVLDLPFIHPGAAAYLFSKGQILGWLGELHPETTLGFGLNLNEAPFLFELDLETVLDIAGRRTKIETDSLRFPPSTRDISLVVDSPLSHDDISAAIAKFPQSKNLRSWNLFDVYQGANIPQGRKSVAWSFSFQSPERTLTDPEVDVEFKQLSEYLTKTFQAVQR